MKYTKNESSRSAHRSKKESAKVILANHDLEKLGQWAKKERNPLRTLTSLLFEEEKEIVWRAIEAIGLVSRRIAGKDLEKIKRQIQQYLWMMNDESGALCWYAPEAISEILAQINPFLEDFALILPSFLIEEPFEAGTRWGMARVITQRDLPDKILEQYRLFDPKIIESLKSPDARIRGNSVLLAKALDLSIPDRIKGNLAVDDEVFDYYDFQTGELLDKPIKSILK